MKKTLLGLMAGFCLATGAVEAQTMASDNKMPQSLSQVMGEIGKRFNVRFKYDVDTTGLVVNYAPSRIRPYSLEESLRNVLSLFDFKAWDQGKGVWKIKPYEYPRRYDSDGRQMVDYLNSLYANREQWEPRREALRREVRQRLGIDAQLERCVPITLTGKDATVRLSKVRKYDGYTVQNIALELQPGYYVCGSIYAPDNKEARKNIATKQGRYPVIICPNGHFYDGRYNKEQQKRLGTLARMGAVCIDYDLFGWGESALQVGTEAHRSSMAHVMQALCGVRLLDYALMRKDVDPTRIASNGGSGGGTHAALLATIDDRFTACCPVVSVCSHFDGGCPCESGMPIQYSQGGTCNIELLATFAPKPVMIVGDEGDWTHTYPTIEIPYMKRVYGFYGAEDQMQSVFLPGERHDFGNNKRQAVYDFFASVWQMPRMTIDDESHITIEPYENLYSFGAVSVEGKKEKQPSGELMPATAIRSVEKLIDQNFNRQLYFDQRWAAGLVEKAQKWTAELNLDDAKKAERVQGYIFTHLKQITKWHNEHPASDVPAGINPRTGERLREVDRAIIADGAQPKAYHDSLMAGLRRELTEEQVEAILDKYTIGKVAFTLKGYQEIVPNLTAEEEAYCLKVLKEAREVAIDYKNMKEISEIFGIAKDKCELYFNTHGRNWRQMYSNYVKKRQAEKKAAQKKQESAKK